MVKSKRKSNITMQQQTEQDDLLIKMDERIVVIEKNFLLQIDKMVNKMTMKIIELIQHGKDPVMEWDISPHKTETEKIPFNQELQTQIQEQDSARMTHHQLYQEDDGGVVIAETKTETAETKTGKEKARGETMAASNGSEYFELEIQSGMDRSFARPSNAALHWAVMEDEEELHWAALASLPSQKRSNFAILRRTPSESDGNNELLKTVDRKTTGHARIRRAPVTHTQIADDPVSVLGTQFPNQKTEKKLSSGFKLYRSDLPPLHHNQNHKHNTNLGIEKKEQNLERNGNGKQSPNKDRNGKQIETPLVLPDQKELGIVSWVSTILQRITLEHHLWKEFYSERRGLPKIVPRITPHLEDSEERSWKEPFVERECRSNTFMGRFSIDVLGSHTDAVHTVFLLASAMLMFSSGHDGTVRIRDIEEGSSISTSLNLGCIIRAVAADSKLVVVGGTEGFIHCWRAVEGLPHLFDFNQRNTEFRLWKHEGSLTSLVLDLARIYSGSGDMTVRVWDCSKLVCLQVLGHHDWVWRTVRQDNNVAIISGLDMYLWDTNSGSQIVVHDNEYASNTYSWARNRTGNLILTGGEDGAIQLFQIRHGNVLKQNVTWNSQGPVHSLASEYSRLVSASSDGKMSLIDVRKLLQICTTSLSKNGSSRDNRKAQIEPPQRMLHGVGGNLFAADIGADGPSSKPSVKQQPCNC